MRNVFVALLVAAPVVASADPAKQLAKDLDVHLSYWSTYRDDPGSRATSLGTDPTPAECDAIVAKARKAGLKDDSRVFSTRFNEWDQAGYNENREAYVTVADLDRMCKRWHKLVLLVPAAAIQTETMSSLASGQLVEPGSWGKGMAEVFVAAGKKCLDVTDQALKAGAPGDHKVKIKDEVMTIVEGRAKACQTYLDWANGLGDKVKAAHAADRAKRAAPYKAAGIDGAKLELFLEYDDVYWRGGAGCQIISDVKALAKAKALFHWLENSDGTHTIRKYTFTGNKVSGPVSKTYKNSSDAQRGCR